MMGSTITKVLNEGDGMREVSPLEGDAAQQAQGRFDRAKRARSSGDRKKCPKCSADIRKDATRCSHCNTTLAQPVNQLKWSLLLLLGFAAFCAGLYFLSSRLL